MKWNKSVLILLGVLLVLCCTHIVKAEEQALTPSGKLDQRGRTGLMVFSGYYGFWLGMVPHVLWESTLIENKGKKMALGPLITTPAALILTHFLTKNRSITRTQTSLISMGGHWGTWQGVGWSAAAEQNKKTVIGIGTISGILGIGGGLLLSSTDLFSEGGAALTHSAMFMGAWFGYVTAELFDLRASSLLTNMLISSDVFMLSTSVLLHNTNFKRSNVTRLNALIYGNATIAWLVYIIYVAENKKQEYDHKTAMAIAGAGSVLGFIGATTDAFWFTEKIPIGRLGDNVRVGPRVMHYTDSLQKNKIIPAAGIQIIF